MKSRRRSVLLLILLLLINIGAVFYLLAFQEPQLASLQGTWFDKRQKTNRADTGDAATIYAQAKKDLQIWDSKILPKKDFARLLGEIFETAANNNLVVKGMTYKPKNVKEEGLLVYSIECSVSGKYAGIKSFIADLSGSRNILLLENISLINTSQTKEEVELKLKLVTYFRMEGQ